jgi:hypothetical protein
MAIKTNYNFNGIEVKNATIKIVRVFGSSKEGWSSLVGVYNTTIEAVPAIGDDEATTKEVLNLIEEFNFSVEFKADERGYISIYKGLTEKFGGTEI